MKFSKQTLSNLTGKAKKLINTPVKKAVITTVAIAAIAFHPYPVAFADNSKLTTVYYVYLNDTYLGTVTNKNVVNKIISEKLKTMEQSYKNMNLQLGSQLKFIPEQVFESTANNEKTLDNLENAIQLKTEAAAIIIDGKPAVYLENKAAAEDAIKKLKLQYVTEDQLKELEARSENKNAALPPLKENETRILNIQLSKSISVESEKVTPEQIFTADQAVSYLQKGTLEETKYKVKDGDVLGSIANGNGLKLADLLALNPGLTADSVLKIDQEINITVPKPFIEVVIEKEMNQQEEIPFQNQVTEDSSMNKGDSKVSQEGQNGLQNVTYHISEKNGAAITKDVTKQEVLKQPVNRVVVQGTKVIPSRGEGSFAWPTVGGYISSGMGYRWGKLHKGIDIARPSNPTIKAADNGVVTFAGWDSGGYGNKVIINHQNGFTTLYGHMSSISVSVGQTVSKGQAIGIMGATGDATGVHLHFEVSKNGALQNPQGILGR
jgi:murein DD-endopeptidase MepM/ murein hydrolase activator NlpD